MKVNEIITEAANAAQQAAIAIAMKKAGKKPKSQVNELAPSPGGPDSGDYFRTLASAWYNGAYDSGSLQKGIKTNQDIERLLQRGIVAPDGVARKYNIDYNSDFDGVVIFSDDYYEHGDHDDTDSRTGKPFGPYDYMEFSDDELSEGIYESAELAEEFDLIESIIERLAEHNGVDAEEIWEDLETLTEDELYAFAVTSEPIMESQHTTEALGLYGPFTVTINTGERPQSRTKTKKFRREDDAILWAQDWLEDAPQYVFATAEVTDPNGNVVWTTDEQGVAEDDDAVAAFLARGGEVQKLKPAKPRKGERWQGSSHIGAAGGRGTKGRVSGLAANTGKSGKPVVTAEQGMAESEAWQKANNRDRTDGMSQKAVNTYRREHPGSKLKTAVTTKPSKLKRGSKASKRRKSYCSRSRGQMKMHSISCAKTPDKAICKARRRWNC